MQHSVKALPNSIFKYYHFREQDGTIYSLEALRNNYVYAGPPTAFNDPFDCAISAVLTITKNSLKTYCEFKGKTPSEIDEVLKKIIGKDGKLTPYGIQWQRDKRQQIQALHDKFGVCCFSSSPYCPLMWGHYADSHTGYCLEFSTQDPFKTKQFENEQGLHIVCKVRYLKRGLLPQVSLADFISGSQGKSNKSLSLITSKGKNWKYEKEYRLIIWPKDNTNDSRKVFYPNETLKSVLLGKNTSPENETKIDEILGMYPYIKKYRMDLSEKHFRMVKKVTDI